MQRDVLPLDSVRQYGTYSIVILNTKLQQTQQRRKFLKRIWLQVNKNDVDKLVNMTYTLKHNNIPLDSCTFACHSDNIVYEFENALLPIFDFDDQDTRFELANLMSSDSEIRLQISYDSQQTSPKKEQLTGYVSVVVEYATN